MELDIFDYEILEFAASREKFTAKELAQHFHIEVNIAKKRLHDLTVPTECMEFINGRSMPDLDSSYLTYVDGYDNFAITVFGRSLLKSYLIHKSDEMWKKWEDRIWKFVPIVISTLALIISFLAYTNTQQVQQYIHIEVTKETIDQINGNQSQNVFDSKNSLEKNGIQQKK